MDVLLIAFLIVLNGAFAMSELALASSRKARLAAMAEAGDRGAQSALRLMDEPTTFLSTVQVGITSIGVLNGIVGEAAFSDDFSRWLREFGMPERAASITATGVVVTIITFITIVFGELVPKRIGQLYPEPVARFVSPPMAALARAAAPFVKLLSWSTKAVLKLLRIDVNAAPSVTQEEIAAQLAEGLDAGVIEAHEHEMVRNVFHLDDRPLTSFMMPRADIAWLAAETPVSQALREARADGDKGGHSWYPVCRGGLDDVVGVIGVARLLGLAQQADTREQAIEQHVLPAVFVPETLNGLELLEQFRGRQRGAASPLVFVVDEYGVVQGMITPFDLLEAITGELQPSSPADAWATLRPDGSWLLDGQMPAAELKARLDIRELPAEDRGRYNTLAGLLMAVSGRLPATGEVIETAGWRFEVIDLDGRRIDKVLATALPPAADPADPAE